MKREFNHINLTLPFYPIPPEGGNTRNLSRKAKELLKQLEEMGVFTQNEFEPAGKFSFPSTKEKNNGI